MTGDTVVASAHSRYLLEKGWKGSRKSVPAAYLTGYLAGKKAIGKGAKGESCILELEDLLKEWQLHSKE